MSLYIKGLEMPKAGMSTTINIHADGTVYVYGTYQTELHKAARVPPHGRLIDADAMIHDIEKAVAPTEYIKNRNSNMVYFLRHQETIIPPDDK